jgi:glycosyltransferase involved in cell wall biosynthesis
MPVEPLPITVIVPVYNRTELLGEALTSALTQKPPPAKVIVVDDGSTEDVKSVVARFPQVDLVRQKNRGAGSARNEGLRRAETTYVLFLDHDDRLLPGALARAVDLLHDAPDAAFVSGRCRPVRADGEPWELNEPVRPRVTRDHYREMLIRPWIVPPATALIRRDLLVAAGGWPEDQGMRVGEDYELFLRLVREYPCVDTEDIFADYRMHGANTSTDAANLLAGITYVLQGEAKHTRGNKELERARLAGLRYWRAKLGIKAAGQNLMRAARTRKGIPAALIAAAGVIGRHPGTFATLVTEHVAGASARGGVGGLKGVINETRRRLG